MSSGITNGGLFVYRIVRDILPHFHALFIWNILGPYENQSDQRANLGRQQYRPTAWHPLYRRRTGATGTRASGIRYRPRRFLLRRSDQKFLPANNRHRLLSQHLSQGPTPDSTVEGRIAAGDFHLRWRDRK